MAVRVWVVRAPHSSRELMNRLSWWFQETVVAYRQHCTSTPKRPLKLQRSARNLIRDRHAVRFGAGASRDYSRPRQHAFRRDRVAALLVSHELGHALVAEHVGWDVLEMLSAMGGRLSA